VSGFIAMPTVADIKRLESQIHELRIILSTLMQPDVFERFREDWFPPHYIDPEK
jgi:hypothetical protein